VATDPLSVLAMVALLLLFSLAVSWMAVLVGVLVDEPEKVMMFGFAVLFPLTFVSNAFVHQESMPGWMSAVVSVNPVTHVADACRGLLSGGEVAGPALLTLLWAGGIVAIFAPLSVRAFRRRL
jgi:ABC-type multidrug transport system permease subunit